MNRAWVIGPFYEPILILSQKCPCKMLSAVLWIQPVKRYTDYIAILRKQAYSNKLKILPQKKWKFSDKNSDIFHISAQSIDCGTRYNRL